MAKLESEVKKEAMVEPVVENDVPKNEYDMEAILRRLERLEQENNELREGKMNVFTEGKKRYEGPRAYSYKMWGGVPVLSFKPFKKDPTKDLVYQNQFKQWISNHYLRLKLADGNEVEVEVNEFNRDYTSSDKIIGEVRTDNRGNILGIAFNTDEYGEILVEMNIIN